MKKIIHKINLNLILLVLIICTGFALRVFNLSGNPAGFFCDEASIGYNAYSLLKTGKDEYGVSFPIFFQSFGDYRPPLAVYSAIPFIAVFGLNELSTRLPSVLYGLLTIITMYFIGKEISSGKSSFGLLTAFTTATMPWFIHYNRTGFEFTIYVTFFTLTTLLLLKAIHNNFFILPAFIFAALTLYTYQPARLLIPLLLFGMLLIYIKNYSIHKKEIFIALPVFFVLSFPLIWSLFTGEGIARFNMISIFSAKLSLTQTLLLAIHNYFIQLSPSYFVSGEPTFITRHFVRGLTPLLIVTLPFSILGIIYTFLTINKKTSQVLLYWLLIYPVAGAVTAEGPFTSRSIIGAPLFAIFIGLGISTTVFYTKRFITPLIITAILFNLIFFTKFYFTLYPLYSSDIWGWQYGARDIVRYFSAHEKSYDDLIMAPEFNAPDIFFKFYAPGGCVNCRIGLPDNSYVKGRRQLFAIAPSYITSHPDFIYTPVKTIYYPNSKVAFILVNLQSP